MKRQMMGLALLSCCILVGTTSGQTSKAIDLCSVFSKPPRTTSNIVVKAYLSHSTVSRVDGADDFLYSPNCNDPDHFVTFGDSKSGAWRKFQRVFDRLPREKANILEIVFLGSVDVSNSGLFGTLSGWARGEVTITTVLSLRDVTGRKHTIVPNWDGDNTEAERIEALREMMLAFLSNSATGEHNALNSSLTDDFRMTIEKNEVLSRQEYLDARRPYIQLGTFKRYSISREITTASTTEIDAVGKIEVISENEKDNVRYRCDLKFEIIDGVWKIRQAQLRRVSFF